MKEKTNRKSVAPRKVKGTVLFTVVCVMMVLIVFLLGTLALAATANKRANYNFQKEQTETIARSVLDSVVTALNDTTINDPSNTNSIKSKVESMPDAGMTMKVQIKQVNADGTDGAGYDDYDVDIVKAQQKMYLYDDVTDSWYPGEVYQMSTTVTTAAGNAPSTYSIYLFRGTTPSNPGSGGGGGGGAFVSLGDVGNQIGTGGNVTGGTQIGLGNGTDNTPHQMMNDTQIESPFLLKGSLKTNANVRTYFAGLGDQYQKQYFAVTGDFVIENNYNVSTAVNANTGLPKNVISEWTYTTKDSNNIETTHTNREREDIPSFYVGGTFYYRDSQISFGDDNMPVNMYLGAIQPPSYDQSNPTGNYSTLNSMKVVGNVYLFDETKESYLKTQLNGSSMLYNWGTSLLDQPSDNLTYSKDSHSITNFGNMYCAGSMRLGFYSGIGNPLIAGDLRIAKDLNLDVSQAGLTMTIGGDFVVGGSFGTYNNTQNITIKCRHYYGPTPPSNVTIQTTETQTDYNCPYPSEIYPANCTKAKIESDIIKMPPATDYTDETVYPRTLEHLNTTEFKQFLNAEGKVPKKISMESGQHKMFIFNTTTHQYEVDNSVYLPTNMGDPGIYKVVGDTLIENVTLNKNLYIDATAGKTVVVFDKVNLSSGCSIIVNNKKDATTRNDVYFFLKTGDALHMYGGHILTVDYVEKISNKTFTEADVNSIKAGEGDFKSDNMNFRGLTIDKYGDTWSYPHLYIFGEDGSKLTQDNNYMMTANVRAPGMTYTTSNGAKSATDLFYNEGNGNIQNFKHVGKTSVGLIGQLIVGNASVGNEWGMIYVAKDPPGAGGGSSGFHGSMGGSQVYTQLYFNYF